MTSSLHLWAALCPSTLPRNWRACAGQICAGDLRRGTMVWLIPATTVLPTLIHLAAGLGAIAARIGLEDAKIAAILRPAHDMLLQKHGPGVWAMSGGTLCNEALTASQ